MLEYVEDSCKFSHSPVHTLYIFFYDFELCVSPFFSPQNERSKKKKARKPIPMNMKLAHLYFMIFWRSNNKLINMRMHKIFINMLHLQDFSVLHIYFHETEH